MPYLCGLWRFANAYIEKDDMGQKLVIKNIDFLNDFAREEQETALEEYISQQVKEKMNEENQ